MINISDKPNTDNGEQYYSAEGVYLNSKGVVVYGKDPDRKTQIVAPGTSVPMAVARRYGLVTQPSPPVEAVEEKAVTVAPANKARASAQNKGKRGK